MTTPAPSFTLTATGKDAPPLVDTDRKSTRLNSSHLGISYAVFCLKKKNNTITHSGTYKATSNTITPPNECPFKTSLLFDSFSIINTISRYNLSDVQSILSLPELT